MSITRLLSGLLATSLLIIACGEKLSEEQLYTKAKDAELAGEFSRAEKHYKKLHEQYPQSTKLEEVQAKLAQLNKANNLGEAELRTEIQNYERQQDFNAALVLSQALVQRFPKSAGIDEILQKIGMICLNNQQQYQRAVDAFQRLLTDFPQSPHVPQAQFMVGYIYANHIKDLDKARLAYTAFKDKYPTHELTPSVDWELEHLGQDISELNLFSDSADQPAEPASVNGAAQKKSQTGPNVKP